MKETEIKRCRKNKEHNSIYAILENWYEEMQECTNFKKLESLYDRIYGIFYGLNAAHFITETELNQIKDELMRLYKEKVYKTV